MVIEKLPSKEKPWLSVWGNDLPNMDDCECTAVDYLLSRNKDNMNLSALRYFDRQITYADFFANIRKTAKAFKKIGVKKGDIVSMVSVMTPETIYCFYALDLLGATLNLADPRTSTAGIHDYFAETKSDVIVSLSVAYPKIEKAIEGLNVKKVIVNSPADSLPAVKKFMYNTFKAKEKITYNNVTVSWNDFIADAEKEPDVKPVPYEKDHAILIVHTGGTTGSPKCVLLSDYALNALAAQVSFKRHEKGERFLNIMPPFIAYGYGYGTHTPLSVGLEVVLIPQFDPNKFGRLIVKYKTQHTAGVPLHYQGLVNDPYMKNKDLSFLKTTGCGGDGISTEAESVVNEFLLAHGCKYKLCKGYGMTEVFAGACANYEEHNKLGSVGIPLSNTVIGVFDPETGEELGYNTEGEICVMTPTMMLGYYGMEEETKKVIRTHSDGTVWVHTGDIGRIDEDGFLFFANRIKRIIIRHDGFKVFPTAVESVVTRVKGVEIAVAVAIRDKDHKQGNLPFVFVKKQKGYNEAELEKEIRAVCKEELAEYAVPVAYKFVTELPYTPIGKIDCLKLQKRTEKYTY